MDELRKRNEQKTENSNVANKITRLLPFCPQGMPNQFLTDFPFPLLLLYPLPYNTNTFFTVFPTLRWFIAMYICYAYHPICFCISMLSPLFSAPLPSFYPSSYKHGFKAQHLSLFFFSVNKAFVIIFSEHCLP